MRDMDHLASQDGAIMIMAAIWVSLTVLLAIFVVDVGNWFGHKRQLQLRADAGALAAAGEFAITCDSAAATGRAKQYSGVEGSPLYNDELEMPGGIHFRLNSRTYHGQDAPVDETVVEGEPCDAKMVDVKLTETDLPWYFRVAQVPFINAHARVSIFQQELAVGALPVGVPDPRPKSARVEFVNEATGVVLTSAPLTRNGTSGGLALWDNSGAPASVPIETEHVGVRVVLSGSSTNTQCGQPLVECYDAGSANGMLHIRGWSSADSAPRAEDVRLLAGTCTDPYFSVPAVACTIGVQADLDFGSGVNPSTVDVKAKVGNKRTAMSYDAASGTWTSPTTISLAPAVGPVPIDIEWKIPGGASGTFTGVQRAFAGSDVRSGPVRAATITDENGALWANSFERCSSTQTSCTHDLVVTIGVQQSLENASDVNDPLVSLRVVGGSQNQALNCDADVPNLKDELAQGCGDSYEINDGTPCPDATEPYECVPLKTGTQRNQVATGMNLRILGDEQATTCTSPNSWSSFPDIPLDDPRIVQVFLTPFGTFQGSGNDDVPVTGFATFYVTGWSGQGEGFSNPCEGQGDDAVPNGEGGYLVGHFIKYVQTLNNGSGGSEPCDFNAFGSCVAVLTE